MHRTPISLKCRATAMSISVASDSLLGLILLPISSGWLVPRPIVYRLKIPKALLMSRHQKEVRIVSFDLAEARAQGAMLRSPVSLNCRDCAMSAGT